MNKLFQHIIRTLLSLFIVSISVGQTTYAIKDTNFRDKLLSNYPQLMVGDRLDSASAAAFSGGLELDNSNISSLDGLQYFINLEGLAARNNNLSTLPELAFATKLERIYLNNNQLVSLPDLSALTAVTALHIPNNALTQLPDLSNMTALLSLYCNDNQLELLPDFSNNASLFMLVAGNNPLQVAPDFSPLVNLFELHINQTNTPDTINGLSQLKKLTVLYAWDNNINDLSALNSNTTLTIFQVFQNNLRTLPDLLNKPNLYSVSFSNNYLTFEDILPLRAHDNFPGFGYNPQKEIPIPNYTQRVNDPLKMTFNIDASINNNQFRWYKNDTLIDNTTTASRDFNALQPNDAGAYRLEISNSILPDLTLETTHSILTVKPCLEILNNRLEQNLIACGQGFDVRITELEFEGGVSPYEYNLFKNKTLVATSDNAFFTPIPAGEYNLVINDSRGQACADNVKIVVDNEKECDLVFTPNGDGVMDTFYINDRGSIKIYNTSRTLVAEFTGPATWDGTNFNGEHLPSGMYAIVVNENKVIRLTLIK